MEELKKEIHSKCSCGGDLSIYDAPKSSSPLALKFVVFCLKCKKWYESNHKE